MCSWNTIRTLFLGAQNRPQVRELVDNCRCEIIILHIFESLSALGNCGFLEINQTFGLLSLCPSCKKPRTECRQASLSSIFNETARPPSDGRITSTIAGKPTVVVRVIAVSRLRGCDTNQKHDHLVPHTSTYDHCHRDPCLRGKSHRNERPCSKSFQTCH